MEKIEYLNNSNNLQKNIFFYEINSYKIQDSIKLNDTEIKIFSLIKNILEKNNKKTICRVAGGWVRDKVIIII